MHIAQYHFGQRFLKPSKLKRQKKLKHKENADLVETFKAKRARYDVRERSLL